MRFGFVGLGQMGAPMAINLAKAYDVTIFDKKTQNMSAIANKGVKILKRPKQLSHIDALILCLPDANAVKQVLFDPNKGFAQYLKKQTIIIDTSTTEYGVTLDIFKVLSTI